jgi:hypothetical protein
MWGKGTGVEASFCTDALVLAGAEKGGGLKGAIDRSSWVMGYGPLLGVQEVALSITHDHTCLLTMTSLTS